MEKQVVRQAGESICGTGGACHAVKRTVGWLVPFAIGIGIAMLIFHKTRFEQQADGVMSPEAAVQLGLIRHDEKAHVERVWFLRARDGWFQYRAAYSRLNGKDGVIHAATRVDIAKVCATMSPADCRLLHPHTGQVANQSAP